MYMSLTFLSFVVLDQFSLSYSFPEKPPPVPPKKGEVGEFFWRPATREIVNLLKLSLDKTVNPCENFYEFACGNYQRGNNITIIGQMQETFAEDIKQFVLNEMPKIMDSKAVNSTKTLLKSCLETTDNSRPQYRRIYEKLVERYSKFSLKEILTEMVKYDIQTSFGTEADENTTGMVFDKPNRPWSDGSKSHAIEGIIDNAVLFDNKTLADGVKDYMKRIWDVPANSPNEVPSSYKPKWIDIDMIKRDMDINVTYYSFLERLDELISQTAEDVVRAHTFLFTSLAVDSVRDIFLSGPDSYKLGRNNSCADVIIKLFPHIVITTITKDQLPVNEKKEVQEVFDNVKASLKEILEQQEWLGSRARESAINRTLIGEQWFGTPDNFYDYSELDAAYQALHFEEFQNSSPDCFLNHLYSLLRFTQTEKMGQFKSERNYLLFNTKPQITALEGFHEGNYGLTVVTTGRLQSSIIDSPTSIDMVFLDLYSVTNTDTDWPTTILPECHPIVNPFQEKPGSFFTSFGEISQSTTDEFRKRANCLVDQFKNETLMINGTHYSINSKHNLNENTADNSGYRVAFQAYKKLMEATRRPKVLREFDDFTSDQMFFISTAQFFCSIDSVESAKLLELHDLHAPNPIRVNAVRNSDDFAKAFKCPVGSKMNPQKKCRLWD